MKRFASGLRRVSVSRLALLLAGLLCAPCLALAATSIDVSSVTNVYFVTYDDYRDYVSNGVAFADSVIAECDSLDSSIYAAKYYARASIVNSSNAYSHIETVRNSGNVTGYDAVSLRSASQSALAAIARSEDSIRELDVMASSNAVMRSEAMDVKSALLSDVPTYQIIVYDGQGGGGGCSCPDYTGILNSIYSRLSTIIGHVHDISTYVLDLYYVIPNFILGIEETLTGGTDWSDLTNSGIDAGNRIGEILSNSWDYVYYANLYPQIGNGIFSDTPVSQGPAFVREMWNYILRPIAQTWSDYNYATDNRMISGFRDFYVGTHYDFPTNTPRDALNVKLVSDSDSIGGDESNPLYVEVTQSGAPVSVYNPVWITFTNRVSLSADTLAALTNHAGLVRDLLNGVTSAVYQVTILQSSYTEQQEAEREAVNDAAEEADADTSDPDADTVDLPRTDISRVNNIGGSLHTIYTSYAGMFDSVSSEPPDDIMIHQGWTLGGIEVPSMHWHPSDDGGIASMLRLIRGCFSALWFVLYVLVVWSAIAVDIFVAGVCIYSVYGLLLGKPETTLKGIKFMFNLLCSLLGRDPPSK